MHWGGTTTLPHMRLNTDSLYHSGSAAGSATTTTTDCMHIGMHACIDKGVGGYGSTSGRVAAAEVHVGGYGDRAHSALAPYPTNQKPRIQPLSRVRCRRRDACPPPKNLPTWRRGGLRTLAEVKSLCS